jgi:DNA-directed RNA polymerase specialized sigma24 family protein
MVAPPFNETLRQALAGVDNEDVRIFYAYFEDLKRQARRHLGRKAATHPGESAVVQSALLSLLCDLALQGIPLADVDEYGYPMLWPLMLQYLERHCDKWNKYYLAKKRQGVEIPLASGSTATGEGGLDLADYREGVEEEQGYVSACAELYAQLSEEERVVLEGRLQDKSLEEIAAQIGRAASTVSNRLKRIRTLLEQE